MIFVDGIAMNHVTKHRAVGTNNDRVIVQGITRVLTRHYAVRHLKLTQQSIIRDSMSSQVEANRTSEDFVKFVSLH